VRFFSASSCHCPDQALATVGIYNAVALWNEFVFAYVLTSSPARRTLPLAIWDYQGQYAANIPLIMSVLSLSALAVDSDLYRGTGSV
jgi:ABC-type glycerol-3-phosphate transport system permease component